MLPAIVGALKAASWAQRGIIAGIIVGVFVLVFGVGYFKGKRVCNEQHARVALDQAIDAKEQGAKTDAKIDKLTEAHEQQDRIDVQRGDIVTKEIIRYVETSRPVQLDPEFIRLTRELQRLQREAEDRVLRAHAPAREADAVSPEGLTTDQLLQAYEELGKARREDLGAVAYCQDFEATRYKDEMDFYHPK